MEEKRQWSPSFTDVVTGAQVLPWLQKNESQVESAEHVEPIGSRLHVLTSTLHVCEEKQISVKDSGRVSASRETG